jgi:hypothetical protein
VVLFSEMLGTFLTGVFISLLVQAFSYNLLGLTRRALGAVRTALYDIMPEG